MVILHKGWSQYLTFQMNYRIWTLSCPHLPTAFIQSKYFCDAQNLTVSLFILIPGTRDFLILLSGQLGVSVVEVYWRSPWAPAGQVTFSDSVPIMWCHRLVTLFASQLGHGTSHHDSTNPFGRICKLSLLALSSAMVLWAIIEVNKACCCYITFLILSRRRQTDEGKINSLLRSP